MDQLKTLANLNTNYPYYIKPILDDTFVNILCRRLRSKRRFGSDASSILALRTPKKGSSIGVSNLYTEKMTASNTVICRCQI